MKESILIIGAGNMGSAFYRGLQPAFGDDAIAVCDTSQERLDVLGAKKSSTDPDELLSESDIVLFAVKPQSFDECIDGIGESLTEKIIISIMAGVSLQKLMKKTGVTKVVRAMPNLAASVGKAVTGWVATDDISDDEKKSIQHIFEAIGSAIELDDESMIDAITPLSGSGPAYFFYVTELIEKKAKQMGFSDADAKMIAEQTFIGTAAVFSNGAMNASQFREAVTSKGGVTEAALTHMEDKGFDEIFLEALEEARKRCGELGTSPSA